MTALKRFREGDRWYVRAQQIWLILVTRVMSSKRDPDRPATITYGALAKRMGFADGRAGHVLSTPLGIIGRFCLENDLPPLNAIVVKASDREPGDAVYKRPNRTVAEEQADVMQVDWFSLRVPTTGTFRDIYEQAGDE